MITLRVGQNQPYSSPQHAINTLIDSYGQPAITSGSGYSASVPALSADVTIEIDEGVYGGFEIPSGSLGRSSAQTITIKSFPGHLVTITGMETSTTLGHGHSMVGVGIGNSLPHVRIRGLRIENFLK